MVLISIPDLLLFAMRLGQVSLSLSTPKLPHMSNGGGCEDYLG